MIWIQTFKKKDIITALKLFVINIFQSVITFLKFYISNRKSNRELENAIIVKFVTKNLTIVMVILMKLTAYLSLIIIFKMV